LQNLEISVSLFQDAATRALPVAAQDAPRRAKRLPMLLAAVAAMGSLGACAGSRGGNIPYDVQDFGAPDSPAIAALEPGYRIAPLDTLKIAVFQLNDLSGDFEVDLAGNIGMPLIGNIRAVGMTTEELDAAITRMLAEKYLRSPDVNVGVKSSSTRVVTVDGSVGAPGVFPVNGKITLLQVVAMAKGTTPDANPRRVAIFRQIEGQRMAAAFDLTSIRRGTAEDPRVYSGDIVVVDGSKVREIQREVMTALPILGIFRPF
jgi:polysaccharide export outer membrane protein